MHFYIKNCNFAVCCPNTTEKQNKKEIKK